MASPTTKMLSLSITAKPVGIKEIICSKKFALTMPPNNCITKLDDVVKDQLKDQLGDVVTGDLKSFQVNYMVHLHTGKPFKVERDGKQSVSDLFSPNITNNKVCVTAIVSEAPARGHSNKRFAATGSKRSAALKANSDISMCNIVHRFTKDKTQRDAKNRAEKEKKRRQDAASNQPSKKRPVFKGEGQKLCDPTRPLANSSDVDELGKECDEIDRDIPIPGVRSDAYGLSSYLGQLGREEYEEIRLGHKMATRNVVGRENSFIERMMDGDSQMNKMMKNMMKQDLRHRHQDNMHLSALAQVTHGNYEIKRLTIEQAQNLGIGRVLSDTRGPGDPSDNIEIRLCPVIGSVEDGDVRGSNKEYSILVTIMGDDELRQFLDFIYHQPTVPTNIPGVQISGKYLIRPENFINCCPELFWNVIYKTQPVVPEEGRLSYDEMLQNVMPDLEWEYLRTSVVTRASKYV